MRKKRSRLFCTSIAIGMAGVLGFSARILNVPPEVVAPEGQAVVPQSVLEQGISNQPIKILNIYMLTVPSYNLGDMSNTSTFDMSSLPDRTQVTGFSVTVDRSCDLQLDMINKPIPLSGGQATLVNLDDLISGTQGGDGISLKTFRAFCGNSVTINGKLKKNGRVVGNLSLTIKL